jgi:hypothetical protein
MRNKRQLLSGGSGTGEIFKLEIRSTKSERSPKVQNPNVQNKNPSLNQSSQLLCEKEGEGGMVEL